MTEQSKSQDSNSSLPRLIEFLFKPGQIHCDGSGNSHVDLGFSISARFLQ